MVYEKRDRSCAENFNIFSLLIHEDADIKDKNRFLNHHNIAVTFRN